MRGRPERRRDLFAVLAAFAVALLLWFLWPGEPAKIEAAPAPAPTAKASTSAPKPVRKAKPAPPARPSPADVDEARLRAAVLARAPDLRSCPVPAGAPAQVPVQLGIRISGEVRTVKFAAGESIPAPLAICLRERLVHWRFDDVQLSSDIQLFATFAVR